MNRKQLVILLLVAVVLGGIGVVVYQKRAASWQESHTAAARKLLPDFPLNDVAQITISSSTAEVNLARGEAGWTVRERGGYPANFEQVSGLLRKAWELKPVQEVKAGPSQFARLELVEPGSAAGAGTLVDFKNSEGRRIGSLLLGKKHLKSGGGEMAAFGGEGFPAGRYVRALGQPQRVTLVADPFTEIEPSPEKWLNKEFFRVEKPKSVGLTGPSPTMLWTLTREVESADWKFAYSNPGEELDKNKASSAVNAFLFPSFNDVMPADAKPDTTGLDKPSTVKIETFDGFAYTIQIGKLVGENFALTVAVNANIPKERLVGKDEKPEDKARLDQEFAARFKELETKLANEKKLGSWVFLVPKYSVEALMKERSQLLVEKTPAAPTAGSAPGSEVSVTAPPVTAPAGSPKRRAR